MKKNESAIKRANEIITQLNADIEILAKEKEKLKEQNEWLEKCKLELGDTLGEANKTIAGLKSELKKWKEEHHEQVILANEEGWNRTQLQIENTELKKENNILINGLGCQTCYIHLEFETLNTQIRELKKDLQTTIEANKKWLQRDTKLEEQIEKMKNMQNCKHNWETKGQCVLNNGGYCICDKWELAE